MSFRVCADGEINVHFKDKAQEIKCLVLLQTFDGTDVKVRENEDLHVTFYADEWDEDYIDKTINDIIEEIREHDGEPLGGITLVQEPDDGWVPKISRVIITPRSTTRQTGRVVFD